MTSKCASMSALRSRPQTCARIVKLQLDMVEVQSPFASISGLTLQNDHEPWQICEKIEVSRSNKDEAPECHFSLEIELRCEFLICSFDRGYHSHNLT